MNNRKSVRKQILNRSFVRKKIIKRFKILRKNQVLEGVLNDQDLKGNIVLLDSKTFHP